MVFNMGVACPWPCQVGVVPESCQLALVPYRGEVTLHVLAVLKPSHDKSYVSAAAST